MEAGGVAVGCGGYIEVLGLPDGDADVAPEHKIAIYDSVLYLIFLPVYGTDALETSPQILMKILKESMDLTGVCVSVCLYIYCPLIEYRTI